jgi:hypothetical protein
MPQQRNFSSPTGVIVMATFSASNSTKNFVGILFKISLKVIEYSSLLSFESQIYNYLLFDDVENNNETVEGLAYDPVDQMLLWTDGFNRSIRRVQIDHDGIHVEENTAVEVVHFLNSEEKPRGLVVDPCTR